MRSPGLNRRILILYTLADHPIASILYDRLRDEGVYSRLSNDAFIRDRSFEQRWNRSENVIVLWSHHSRDSRWLSEILPEVIETAERVVPLIITEDLEDDPSDTLPDTLSTRVEIILPRDTFTDVDDLNALVEILLQEFEFAWSEPEQPAAAAYAEAPAVEALPDFPRMRGHSWSAPKQPVLGLLMAVALTLPVVVLGAETLFQVSEVIGRSLLRLQAAISARHLINSGALFCLFAAALWITRHIVETIGAWKIVRALRDMPDFTDQSGPISLTR